MISEENETEPESPLTGTNRRSRRCRCRRSAVTTMVFGGLVAKAAYLAPPAVGNGA